MEKQSEYSPAIPAPSVETTVPASLHGSRLDAAAAQLFPDYSRARLRQWIEAGALLHNACPATRPRQLVEAGDRLQLTAVPTDETGTVRPQALALTLRHVDDALAVIDKPAGLTVHPGAGIADGTLQNALLHHFPQTAAVPRAGLVHRLDKDTSGLLLVALTLTAHTRLVAALARRDIHREYEAVTLGDVTAGGRIEAAVGRDPRNRTRMAVVASGRHAVTHYQVIERYPRHTRLAVQLETGRTHQIRVHLASLRHPIVGDAVYAAGRRSGVEVADAFPRQALHARRLQFAHPVTGASIAVESPLPDDMAALIDALRGST